MIEAVIQVWFWDEKIKGQCKNLINSMPRRGWCMNCTNCFMAVYEGGHKVPS